MTTKQIIFYLLVFFISLSFTVTGIFQTVNEGGPCNAGLLFLMLMFVLFLCLLLLVVPFIKIIRNKLSEYAKPLTIASLVTWTFCMFTFGKKDDGLHLIIYLSFFDFFILLTLFFANEMQADR